MPDGEHMDDHLQALHVYMFYRIYTYIMVWKFAGPLPHGVLDQGSSVTGDKCKYKCRGVRHNFRSKIAVSIVNFSGATLETKVGYLSAGLDALART